VSSPRTSQHEVQWINAPGQEAAMWDTVVDSDQHLSHDLPCPRCGHALHTFLVCDDRCDCAPCVMPGSDVRAAVGL
jgi:hypothetical protein